MDKRLKILRETLNLSQEEFGKRIGSKRNTIANYELGRRSPSDAILLLMCKTFNVNYEWLVDGKGEMFVNFINSSLDDLAITYNLNTSDVKLIRKYLDLSPKERENLKRLINHFK